MKIEFEYDALPYDPLPITYSLNLDSFPHELAETLLSTIVSNPKVSNITVEETRVERKVITKP